MILNIKIKNNIREVLDPFKQILQEQNVYSIALDNKSTGHTKFFNADLDTTHFSGNQPTHASLEACFSRNKPNKKTK